MGVGGGVTVAAGTAVGGVSVAAGTAVAAGTEVAVARGLAVGDGVAVATGTSVAAGCGVAIGTAAAEVAVGFGGWVAAAVGGTVVGAAPSPPQAAITRTATVARIMAPNGPTPMDLLIPLSLLPWGTAAN